jgi:hypothetical protein
MVAFLHFGVSLFAAERKLLAYHANRLYCPRCDHYTCLAAINIVRLMT